MPVQTNYKKLEIAQIHKIFNDGYKFIKENMNATKENTDWLKMAHDCTEICKENNESQLSHFIMAACYDYLQVITGEKGVK